MPKHRSTCLILILTEQFIKTKVHHLRERRENSFFVSCVDNTKIDSIVFFLLLLNILQFFARKEEHYT